MELIHSHDHLNQVKLFQLFTPHKSKTKIFNSKFKLLTRHTQIYILCNIISELGPM